MKVAISWKANTPYGLTEVYPRPTGSCFHRRYHHHNHQITIIIIIIICKAFYAMKVIVVGSYRTFLTNSFLLLLIPGG
jgi:hypothetical protein